MQAVFKFFDRVQKVEDVFCVTILALMVVAAFAQVLIRYVFKAAIPGPEELSRMFQIMITYAGCAIAVREGSQINIDVLANVLANKPAAKRIQNIIIYVLGIFFGITFTWYFYDFFVYAIASKQVTIALGFPLAITIGVMFLSIILTLLHYIELLIRELAYNPRLANPELEGDI